MFIGIRKQCSYSKVRPIFLCCHAECCKALESQFDLVHRLDRRVPSGTDADQQADRVGRFCTRKGIGHALWQTCRTSTIYYLNSRESDNTVRPTKKTPNLRISRPTDCNSLFRHLRNLVVRPCKRHRAPSSTRCQC